MKKDDLYTTLASSTTTILSNTRVPDSIAMTRNAYEYVESMLVEELT